MEQDHSPDALLSSLNDVIEPFSLEDHASYTTLADKVGDARIVLLGESSHGTKEFYQARFELTKYLIEHKGFHAIAIEGDWTSANAVNRCLQGEGEPEKIDQALNDFKRFPEWMWRNTTMLAFLTWLRRYNDGLIKDQKIGFYGLDLYCLSESMQAVIAYLSKHDAKSMSYAIERYACFDHMTVDSQRYGYLVDTRLKKSCVHECTEQLLAMQRKAFENFHRHDQSDSDELFYAAQNARLVGNAEHYYRALYESNVITWNIRDQHMLETLQNLVNHLETKLKKPAKIIIWAHNSHVGDARATEMSGRQEVNLGQLVRQHFYATSFHLGFSTFTGSVMAASDWGAKGERRHVVPGMVGSYESLFHNLRYRDFMLDLHANEKVSHLLQLPRLQRAIGVIYRPETERESHYFFTRLPYQFDTIIHLDQTSALDPLSQ